MTTASKLLLTFMVLAAACGEPVDPSHTSATGLGGIRASIVTPNGVATSIVFDQTNAGVNIGNGWPAGGTHAGMQFYANPHLGDAIVATWVWRGTTNTISDVTDHLEDGTPVGNHYTLVDFVTINGWAMATYIATNVSGFSDPAPSPDKILAVHAIFPDGPLDVGEFVSAYRGVSPVTPVALAAHRIAAGVDSTTAIADPGTLPVDAGALAYAVTMADEVVDLTGPSGFAMLTTVWNTTNKLEAYYAVAPDAGTVDPQFTWSFDRPSNWLANAVALNPQTATHLAFRVQPSRTLLPGQSIAPAVQVAVLDDQDYPVTGFDETVTVSLAHDGSLLHNAHLSGTTVATTVNGVATFANLSIDEPGMGYTLQVAADHLTGAMSDPFNVTIP